MRCKWNSARWPLQTEGRGPSIASPLQEIHRERRTFEWEQTVFNRRRPRPEDPERPPQVLEGGTVTEMKSQVRDPERVSIFINGQFAFGIGVEQAVSAGVRIGVALTTERVQELVALDEMEKATSAALDLLARRPRSTREIRDRLAQRGFAEPAVDAAMERLEGWNYVDDADFARYWVENREANRPRGKRMLEQELRLKGVDRETSRAAIEAAEPDEFAAALTLAQSKLRTYAGLDDAVAKRRLAGFLGRRGYGYDVIGPVTRRLFDGDDGDDDESGGETAD